MQISQNLQTTIPSFPVNIPLFVSGAVLSLSLAVNAATPTVFEPFNATEYPIGESFSAKDGGIGFSTFFSSNPQTIATSGTTFGNAATSGNAMSIGNSGGFFRYSDFTPNTGQTLWTTFLVSKASVGSENPFDSWHFSIGGILGTPETGSPGGQINWSLIREDDSSYRPRLSAKLPEGVFSVSESASVTVNPDETYLFVSKFENFNNGSSGNSERLTAWVLSVNNYNSIASLPSTEGSLEVNNTAKITIDLEVPIFPSTTLQFFSSNDGTAATFDELRIGSSLAEVMPSAVPEPNAILGVALLLGGFVAFRRFRLPAS